MNGNVTSFRERGKAVWPNEASVFTGHGPVLYVLVVNHVFKL